jgi:hypothetical protein
MPDTFRFALNEGKRRRLYREATGTIELNGNTFHGWRLYHASKSERLEYAFADMIDATYQYIPGDLLFMAVYAMTPKDVPSGTKLKGFPFERVVRCDIALHTPAGGYGADEIPVYYLRFDQTGKLVAAYSSMGDNIARSTEDLLAAPESAVLDERERRIIERAGRLILDRSMVDAEPDCSESLAYIVGGHEYFEALPHLFDHFDTIREAFDDGIFNEKQEKTVYIPLIPDSMN